MVTHKLSTDDANVALPGSSGGAERLGRCLLETTGGAGERGALKCQVV